MNRRSHVFILIFIFVVSVTCLLSIDKTFAAVSCKCEGSIAPSGLVAALASSFFTDEIKKGCQQYGGTYDGTCKNAKVTVNANSKEECEKMTVDSLAKALGFDLSRTVDVPVIGKVKVGEYISVQGSCKADSSSSPSATNSSASTKSGCTGDKCVLPNPLGNVTEVSDFVGLVLKGVLGIVGALALFFFVQGGFAWMTSAGNAERIKQGKDTMMWAAMGVLVIFISYTFLNFILKIIGA